MGYFLALDWNKIIVVPFGMQYLFMFVIVRSLTEWIFLQSHY